MKTPKELAIEKAYGEHWESVKNYVDQDGWFDGTPVDNDLSYAWNKMYWDCDKGHNKIRPKSLAGTENNNGWKKSNEELPPDNNTLVWTICNGVKSIMMYSHKHFDDNNGNLFDIQRVSEWQPVIVPADKLY